MSDKINDEMLAALKGLYETGAPAGISLTAEEMRARFDYAKTTIQKAEDEGFAPIKIDPASIPWRAIGEPWDDEDESGKPVHHDEREHLLATVQIGSCSFHMEARQVAYEHDARNGRITRQHFADGDNETISALHLASGGDSAFETLSIGGRDYVVFMTPFCD